MKYCGKCGMQLSDDTAFCPHCGAAVEAPVPPQNRFAAESGPGAAFWGTQPGADPLETARYYRGTSQIVPALQLYKELKLRDPENWEYYFYTEIYTLMTLNPVQPEYVVDHVVSAGQRAFELINKGVTNLMDRDTIALEICSQTRNMLKALHISVIDNEKRHQQDPGRLYMLDWKIGEALILLGDTMEQLFFDSRRILDGAIHNWKFAIVLKTDRMRFLPEPSQEQNRIDQYTAKIKYYDPTYLYHRSWIGIGNIFSRS